MVQWPLGWCVCLLTFVFGLFAVRYGYRPWAAAAPSAKPWLSKYLAEAAADPDTDSSSSRFSKPSWSSAGSGAGDYQQDEDDDAMTAGEAASDEAYPQTRGSRASQSAAAAAGSAEVSEPLLLHCREVVLLRPRKAPVRVVAPLPRSMRDLLHAMDWT
jgi:hypothetical protein